MYVMKEVVLVSVRWRDCTGTVVRLLWGTKFVERISRNLDPTTTTPCHLISNRTMSQLAPGHFLFTSESVGEGHPGW